MGGYCTGRQQPTITYIWPVQLAQTDIGHSVSTASSTSSTSSTMKTYNTAAPATHQPQALPQPPGGLLGAHKHMAQEVCTRLGGHVAGVLVHLHLHLAHLVRILQGKCSGWYRRVMLLITARSQRAAEAVCGASGDRVARDRAGPHRT